MFYRVIYLFSGSMAVFIESITKALHHVLKEWDLWKSMKWCLVKPGGMLSWYFFGTFLGTLRNKVPKKGNFYLGSIPSY